MRINVRSILVVFVLLNLSYSQTNIIMCGDENLNTSTIDPRTHEVNALMIYISFPEQTQPYPMPSYVNDVESNMWDYFNEMSEGDHELVITTFRRPVPNQNYTYVADNNMSYYQNIAWGMGTLNTEILWKVYNDDNNAFNDIDVIFMNYTADFFQSFSGIARLDVFTFPHFNGIGTTQEEMGSQNTLEWHIAHEYGHLLGMGHHSEGVYCQMDDNSWLEQIGSRPYCTYHLIYKGWIDNNHVIEVNVNMFDVQIQDIRNSGYVYKIPFNNNEYFLVENHQRTGYDMDYPGTGLLVWHKINWEVPDLETADGRFNWQEEYCVEDNHFSHPFVQLNSNANSGKDELDLRKVECCSNGNLITRTHLDITGDIEDMFNMQTSTLFAPWTNPSSNDDNGNFTDIMVKVKSQQGSTIIADLLINAPPRTPKQFRITGGPGDNPTAQWQLNNEPDIAGYRVYRKLDGQNNFVLIYTANTSETNYTDTEVTINRFSPAQAYYHITAFDNAQNESDPTMNRWVSYNAWKTVTNDSLTDYFPMAEGKQWIFYSDLNGEYELTILHTTTYDSLNYYRFEEYYRFDPYLNEFRWGDSNRVYNKADAHVEGGFNDLIFYDFSREVGDTWDVIYYYEMDPTMYEMTLMSKNDTINTLLDTFYNCYRFQQSSIGWYRSWYLDEWFAFDIGPVKRIQTTINNNDTTFITEILIDTNTVVEVLNEVSFPQTFKLHQPFPNPFNPSTTINFTVGARHASLLQVYDITGRLVETLVDGELPTGEHEIVWNANKHPSGVYCVRLQSGEFVETQKVVLMK